MSRADSGCPHNFGVNSWVFKDDESEAGQNQQQAMSVSSQWHAV